MTRTNKLVLALAIGLGTLVAVVCVGVRSAARAAPVLYPPIGPPAYLTADSIDNHHAAVAYNRNRDEYLVVWENYNATEVAIYAQRVGRDGLPIDGQIQVVHWGTFTSCQPAVAYSPLHDKYLVVFATDSEPSLPPYVDYNLWARPINGDGTTPESVFQVPQYANTNNQWHPSVAYNEQWDEFIVVWEEEQGAGGWRNIWAQRVNASDWSYEPGPPCIATGGDRHRLRPQVAYNPDRNEYLIAYTVVPSGTTAGDIYGKVIPAHLPDPLSIGETAICTGTLDRSEVAVAAGPDEYLVTWQNEDGSGRYDIFARRIRGSDGTPLGSPGGFVVNQFSDSSFLPRVAYAPVYGYMVTWQISSATYLEDVYGNYIKVGQEAPPDLAFGVDGGSGNSQQNPDVACAPYGDCLFVDEDNGVGTGGDYEIHGQFMLARRVYLPLVVRNHQ